VRVENKKRTEEHSLRSLCPAISYFFPLPSTLDPHV
jgi:hypothetical protein